LAAIGIVEELHPHDYRTAYGWKAILNIHGFIVDLVDSENT
jgi:hypothetical protein